MKPPLNVLPVTLRSSRSSKIEVFIRHKFIKRFFQYFRNNSLLAHSPIWYFTCPLTIIFPILKKTKRKQALRDYKVTIEYKHLKQHAPGGVYLLPSIDSIRKFYGVIFVRRGPYINGIFKFQIQLPIEYNEINTWPRIIFRSFVYNPHVSEKTGELDLRSEYPIWDPQRHYLVTVLTYLKKIFYLKSFMNNVNANKKAFNLLKYNPDAYQEKVDHCVRLSQVRI